MKKEWRNALAACVIAVAAILILDRLTNRLDVVEGHKWDFVYYIDMAENGVWPWENQALAAPYAYRFITPLLARWVNLALGTPTYFGFKLWSYIGLMVTLVGLYWLARQLNAGHSVALLVMLVPSLALFNVKFLLFDFYRPDQLAYPLLVLAILLLMRKNYFLATVVSLVGILIREYLMIPPLILISLILEKQWPEGRRWPALLWCCLILLGIAAMFQLPRWLIPVRFTQQILDPWHDPNFLRTLIGMPFNVKRDFNYLFNLLGYFLPTLMLATPRRLRSAWQELGQYRRWLIIYAIVNLVGMMYGGTDMMRYVTYFFLPQAFLLTFLLRQNIHLYEILLMIGAVIIFNRLLYLFPIWDFSAYLDFYGGYGDHITLSSWLRYGELFAFISLAYLLRPCWKAFPELTTERLARICSR